MNPFTTVQTPGDDIAAKLVELGRALSTPAERIEGPANLTDRQAWDNGTGQSPRDRMLELMEEPKSGPSLREALEQRTRSPA